MVNQPSDDSGREHDVWLAIFRDALRQAYQDNSTAPTYRAAGQAVEALDAYRRAFAPKTADHIDEIVLGLSGLTSAQLAAVVRAAQEGECKLTMDTRGGGAAMLHEINKLYGFTIAPMRKGGAS